MSNVPNLSFTADNYWTLQTQNVNIMRVAKTGKTSPFLAALAVFLSGRLATT